MTSDNPQFKVILQAAIPPILFNFYFLFFYFWRSPFPFLVVKCLDPGIGYSHFRLTKRRATSSLSCLTIRSSCPRPSRRRILLNSEQTKKQQQQPQQPLTTHTLMKVVLPQTLSSMNKIKIKDENTPPAEFVPDDGWNEQDFQKLLDKERREYIARMTAWKNEINTQKK